MNERGRMCADGALDIAIVVAVNDDEILERNLLRSPILRSGDVRLHTYRDQSSASRAYNRGLAETDSDYVAFVHQDVYLPEHWLGKLATAINLLNAVDPNWGVLGTFGVREDGKRVGCVWSSGLGRVIGAPLSNPEPVISIDELAFVLRRDAGCRFDPDLPSFHLYGTDIVQISRKRSKGTYVANLPVIHNSRFVKSLGGGFAAAYRYMQRKWVDQLPIWTLIVPLTASPIPLLRARARAFLTRRKRAARSVASTGDPQQIARKLGYE